MRMQSRRPRNAICLHPDATAATAVSVIYVSCHMNHRSSLGNLVQERRAIDRIIFQAMHESIIFLPRSPMPIVTATHYPSLDPGTVCVAKIYPH